MADAVVQAPVAEPPTVIVEVPRDMPLDDKIMIAMREARRHHLEWWLSELERHRGHRSFRPWTCVQALEYGFSCGCDGVQRDYALRIGCLKEMLPESREIVLRMFRQAPGRARPRLMHVRDRAEERARSLLFRHLTRPEKWHLRATGSIEVKACGLTFTIRHGGASNIRTEWRGHQLSLCVIPAVGERIPISDVMLQQKVLLESSPELVLDVAYVHDVTAGLFYESGRFLRDGSDPVTKSRGRVLRVDTIPDTVLDEPVEYMRQQMVELTAIEVVSTEAEVERVETRTGEGS